MAMRAWAWFAATFLVTLILPLPFLL